MSEFQKAWHNITLAGAKRVRDCALLKASDLGVPVSVVVVDRTGVILLAFFLRKVMASFLFGLSANDPLVLSIVPMHHGPRHSVGLLGASATSLQGRSNGRITL